MPEIELGIIQESIDQRLTNVGFHNTTGANLIEDEQVEVIPVNQSTSNYQHPQGNLPMAWGWTEPPGFRPYTMRAPRRCLNCDAILFTGETNSICCRNGKMKFQSTSPPS